MRVVLETLRDTNDQFTDVKGGRGPRRANDRFILERRSFVGGKCSMTIQTVPSAPSRRLFFVGSRVFNLGFCVKTIYTNHVYILTYRYRKS